MTIDIDGSRAQIMESFLPSVVSGYMCDFNNNGIELSANGTLTTTVLENSVNGTYTCSSSDLGGDIQIVLSVYQRKCKISNNGILILLL